MLSKLFKRLVWKENKERIEVCNMHALFSQKEHRHYVQQTCTINKILKINKNRSAECLNTQEKNHMENLALSKMV